MKKLWVSCAVLVSCIAANANHAIEHYKEVLAIKVTDIKSESAARCGQNKGYTLLSFGGNCDNEYFKGTVQPGALDTQTTEDGSTSLSARYVLEGTDYKGDKCIIFIENNADMGSRYSKPRVYTDSKALSFLNDSDLVGYFDNEGDFTIRIYAPDSTDADVQELRIPGHHGLLAATLEKPALKPGEKCPLVIICHGFGGERKGGFIADLGRQLPEKGIATLRFDFNGHGESEGRFQDMTVPNEIEDAKKIYQYVSALPFVDTDRIAILGHSQGGVVASMVAGELGHDKIKAAVLMCAAAVLRDDCIRGNTFGKFYNPLDPPETVDLGGGKLLGKEFIETAFRLPIYETAVKYHGSACIIHGTGDRVVPYTYSLRYRDLWPGSEYHELPGYDHGFGPNTQTAVDIAIDYLTRTLL